MVFRPASRRTISLAWLPLYTPRLGSIRKPQTYLRMTTGRHIRDWKNGPLYPSRSAANGGYLIVGIC